MDIPPRNVYLNDVFSFILFKTFHKFCIILHSFFYNFLSLNIMFIAWLIHVVYSYLSLHPHYIKFHILTNYNVFIHSVLDGYLNCLQFFFLFRILNIAAKTILLYVSYCFLVIIQICSITITRLL